MSQPVMVIKKLQMFQKQWNCLTNYAGESHFQKQVVLKDNDRDLKIG